MIKSLSCDFFKPIKVEKSEKLPDLEIPMILCKSLNSQRIIPKYSDTPENRGFNRYHASPQPRLCKIVHLQEFNIGLYVQERWC